MTDGSEPIVILTTARDKLVDERRALAEAIALGHRRRRTDDPHTNEMRENFVALQNTIDAMNRAIDQERSITTVQPESHIVASLVPAEFARS